MASSTMSFFCPATGSVTLEYFVRWAPELAAVMAATTGSVLRPVFCAISVTLPTPKYGSISGSTSPKAARTDAALHASMPDPESTDTTTSGCLCRMWPCRR